MRKTFCMNEPNETEKAFASVGLTGFCNPCYMPCVEWIDGKPYYPAYAARDALEKRIAEHEAQNEELKNELLDAKRDACRFKKAMYRALFNWAHVRTFVYMKEHGMLPRSITPDNLNVPNQWRRALDLCKLGYNFAKIAQDELPKKTKAPEADK